MTLTTLILYWLALATSTHLPRAPELPLEHGDKYVHGVAFALLALLAATCWSAWRPPLRLRHALALAAILLVYAAVDELTQIPVGRQAELADWGMDALGVIVALSLFVVFRWRPKRMGMSGDIIDGHR